MKPYTKPGYRVALRPIQLDDVDAILQWINDPDVTRNQKSGKGSNDAVESRQ